MERFFVDGTQIEYEVHGRGEPVLLITPALIVDSLASPLLAQSEVATRYRLIHYHRRGYQGSTLGSEPLTMARQAADAAALLRQLGMGGAHVAGYSYGGLIALQLAVDAPDLVHSLALLEPALRMVPAGKAYSEDTVLPMMDAYRAGDTREAVRIFCDALLGPDWQPVVERGVPGGMSQVLRDADTWMLEQPAIREWAFGPEEAAAIRQPVLSVLGVRSHRLFQEGRALLHAWFPQTEDADVSGTHLHPLQDPTGVAHALAAFFARHPMG